MIEHPRLKYCYHAQFLDDTQVLLVSEKDKVLLSGKPYSLVLSALQPAGLPLNQLAAKLDGQLSEMEIHFILVNLESRGYIIDASPIPGDETNAFWNTQGIDGKKLSGALGNTSVSLETVGPVEPAEPLFRDVFNQMGIQTRESGNTPVIITDNYQHADFQRINQEALEKNQPWMLVKPIGVELWLGPVFWPGQTGCWECLNQRLRINNPIDTYYQYSENTRDNLPVPPSFVSPSLRIAANMTALEVIKFLYHRKNQRLDGKIVTVDLETLDSREHVLVKRPQCPACGSPPNPGRQPSPVLLEDFKKNSRCCVSTAGGYRECSPEDTLEKYRAHISPITGIVRALKTYHSREGAPVYNITSGPNTALRSKSLFWLNSYIRSANGGKGKTWSQARAGALCEAVERFSLTFQGDEPRITSSLEALDGDGIHPNRCMNFSQRQYRGREEINRTCSKLFAMVPVPFEPSAQIEWTPVYSLSQNRFKYLPTEFCYTQYPSADESLLFAYPDSNGCAAGNSLAEAVLQGFLELVERDCVAVWWYNKLKKPGVDLASFHVPYFNQLMQYYPTIGRRLHVLDITGDMQIPAFAAVSYRAGAPKENIVFGFGAHVDAVLAIERALVELNQLLPIADAPGTDWKQGKYLTDEKHFVHWLETATLENQPYMAPAPGEVLKNPAHYPPLCNVGVVDALECCLGRAEQAGLETLVLDMTRPDIRLPAARVFVPGMRHFWQRLAPGRLYDVPVRMGLIDEPLEEHQLNPIPLFI